MTDPNGGENTRRYKMVLEHSASTTAVDDPVSEALKQIISPHANGMDGDRTCGISMAKSPKR